MIGDVQKVGNSGEKFQRKPYRIGDPAHGGIADLAWVQRSIGSEGRFTG